MSRPVMSCTREALTPQKGGGPFTGTSDGPGVGVLWQQGSDEAQRGLRGWGLCIDLNEMMEGNGPLRGALRGI